METAEHLKMTILSQAFSLFSNVDPSTNSFDQIRGIECDCDVFPVFCKRAEAAIAAPGDQEDVVCVSEIGFDVPLSSSLPASKSSVSPSLPAN